MSWTQSRRIRRSPVRAARYRKPRTGWNAVGYAALRWTGSWFTGRRFLYLLGVLLSASIIWLAGSYLGPGLRAAHGQGIPGSWTALEQDGGQWYGDFFSTSGAVTLRHVSYAGDLSTVQCGTTVPALDTGASDQVYPLTGSGRWVHDVIGIVVGTLGLIGLLARRAAWF